MQQEAFWEIHIMFPRTVYLWPGYLLCGSLAECGQEWVAIVLMSSQKSLPVWCVLALHACLHQHCV
eukprot:3841958-Amphidinium_carterae.1